MKVTQSLLGDFETCGLRAQYKLDRPDWYQMSNGSGRALGTAYHAGLEFYYRNNRKFSVWHKAIEAAWTKFDEECKVNSYTGEPVENFIWDDHVPDAETAYKLLTELIKAYEPHAWPLFMPWTLVSVEERYQVDMGDFVLDGGLDLVMRDGQGFIIGVDNKTAKKAWPSGKEHPRKNAQASLYVALLQTAFPTAPGHRFVFDIMALPTEKLPARFERRISDPQQAHVDAAIERARAFAHTYEIMHVKAGLDLPANPTSNLCSPNFCDMWSGCPFGQALAS